MTVTEEEDRSPRPTYWTRNLLRDGRVWRDVVVNSISGLIVVFISYLAGLWLGLIQSPNGLKSAFHATWLMFFIAAIVFIVNKSADSKVSRRIADRFDLNIWMARPISFIAVTLLNVLVVSLGYLVLWIAFNTINTIFSLHQGL